MTMTTTSAESHDEWACRQGGPGVRVGNALLYPSGAVCTDMGIRIDPPADEENRLRRQVAYWREKLTRTERDLADLVAVQRSLAGWWKWPVERYGPDPGEPEAAVDRLRAEADQDRQELERVTREAAAVAPWVIR